MLVATGTKVIFTDSFNKGVMNISKCNGGIKAKRIRNLWNSIKQNILNSLRFIGIFISATFSKC